MLRLSQATWKWRLLVVAACVGWNTLAFLPNYHCCSFKPRVSILQHHQQQQRIRQKSVRHPEIRISVLHSQTQENFEEEQDDDDSPTQRRRKRDRIKDWMKSSSGSEDSGSPLVRPIRMEDGSIVEDPSSSGQPARFKTNFGDLFSGMPSMQDILSSGGDGDGADSESEQPADKKQTNQPRDETWFEEQKRQIEDNYQEILNQMMEQLEEQRRQDPETVPSNAEALIKDVLKQEMEAEMAASKEAMAKKMLEEYTNSQREAVESQDMEGVSNEVVDNLMKQDEEARARSEAAQARVDEYRRYELEAFLKGEELQSVPLPEANADLDKWALERLQNMVENRRDKEDDDFIVMDILEENLEDLQSRIERETKKSSIKPDTMKEWQMYRAIASRLGMQTDEGNGSVKEVSGDEDVSEEQIMAQLQSWKDYLAKEDVLREKSGLARGPRLPFQWQESSRDREIEEAQMKAAMKDLEPKSKVEIRKEVNRKSIEALEKLVATSDPVRSERLRRDLEMLKQELEANDYLDISESELEDREQLPQGPVDLSDIFTPTKDSLRPLDRETVGTESPIPSAASRTSNTEESSEFQVPNSPDTPFFSNEDLQEQLKPPPPSTPFFSEDEDIDAVPAKAPDTPFFSSEGRGQGGDASGGSEGMEYRLGSLEEQKLRAMYQRAGARTDEEKAAIRAQWEEFQSFEKSRRDQSGLTDGNDSDLMDSADLKYDITDVTTEDGDIDAEKILASIGPRPKRGASSRTPTEKRESDVNPTEVSDSLYRSVSAVGGGRTKDDPEAKAQEKAAFSEFIEKENELRDSLDQLDEEVANEVSVREGEFDDVEYAEEVLSSLGPRPKPKRRKRNEAEYSDKGIALKDSDDDDESAVGDGQNQRIGEEPAPIYKMGTEGGVLPAWVERERGSVREREESDGGRGKFLGSDIEDVFDDDAYEHNQRQLAEYERRRSGGKKQMGIDISDVLGRSSDDYADYNFDDNYFRAKKGGWGKSGFLSRKANLLDYTELSVMELNSLMDHKDSIYSTGMSQYLPRINKPFKEFGAIFRLEGVLVDTTGLQYKAWTKVASDLDFEPPSVEDVRRASVLRPEVAVREVFFWTDDVVLVRQAAQAHRNAVDSVFTEWMKESGVASPTSSPTADSGNEQGRLAIGEETVPRKLAMDPLLNLSEDQRIKLLADAWSRTAVTHRLPTPSRDQVEVASVLAPDVAVRKVFEWSVESSEIDRYVASYRSIMKSLVDGKDGDSIQEQDNANSEATLKADSFPQYRPIDQNTMMEMQYKAWVKLAEENGFEPPLPDEAMAAFVINDPAIAITDGFGWTDDLTRVPTLVASYKDALALYVSEWQGIEAPLSTVHVSPAKEKESTVSNRIQRPTEEEMLEMQQHAWKSAALNHGFQSPSADQVALAMKMPPSEVVTRLFGWSSDESVIETACRTYESALRDISQKYINKYKLPADVVLFPFLSSTSNQRQKDSSSTDDVVQVALDAWCAVAQKNNFQAPDEDEILFALSVGPEEAVISGFEWASDSAEVQRIVDEYKNELKGWQSKRSQSASDARPSERDEKTLELFTVIPGAEKWVKSLLDVEMQCSVVSYFNREQVDTLLEASGLSHLFDSDKRVTATNNYSRDVDQLLGAALRNERRPDHCVVFDSSPHSSAAAHDVEMRNVGVIGAFPRYDLLTADSTASSFDELTAMNIRRLFGERVYDQPQVDIQQTDPERRTRTKTKYFWDDD